MRPSIIWLSIVLISVAACGGDAVRWSEVSFNAPSLPAKVPFGRVSPDPGTCPASVRAVRAGHTMYAVWWSARRDSSALLLVTKSPDGGKSWTPPVMADSTDRSVRGCGRPPPSIAVDTTNGYVHLAYFAEPASGDGIFFAHSMDGGRTFHSPVPIVFGDTPASVSVASAGDRVAVVYEDPNSSQPMVGVALSRSMGHIFARREIVSSDNERARQPTVDLHGDTVRVWWSDYSADPRINATRRAYREGIWR